VLPLYDHPQRLAEELAMLDVITKGRAFRAGYRSVGMRYQDEILSVRGRQIRLLRGGKGQPLLYFHDA
jgi:hypothetical protein